MKAVHIMRRLPQTETLCGAHCVNEVGFKHGEDYWYFEPSLEDLTLFMEQRPWKSAWCPACLEKYPLEQLNQCF